MHNNFGGHGLSGFGNWLSKFIQVEVGEMQHTNNDGHGFSNFGDKISFEINFG